MAGPLMFVRCPIHGEVSAEDMRMGCGCDVTTLLAGQLAGRTDAQRILGISKTTLWRWLEPGSGPFGPNLTWLPPGAQTSSGVIWWREDLMRFAAGMPAVVRGAHRRERVG